MEFVARPWTLAETWLLLDLHRGGWPKWKIARVLDRSEAGVAVRLRLVGHDALPARAERQFYRRWTSEEEARLLELVRLGYNRSEIARELGRPYYSVTAKLRELRDEGWAVPPARRAWTPEEDRRLLELLRAGASQIAIARELGRSPKAVSHHVRRLKEDGTP